MPNEPTRVRPATRDDCDLLATLIRDLARYERLEAEAEATGDDLRLHLFGPRPAAEALIAEAEGEPCGFALYFQNFSTFRGRPGLYLEDLYVRPDRRGLGLGRALIAALARIAVDRGCGRMEWSVLDWNEPAIAFYRSLGARPMDEWTTFRVADEPLRRLAARETIR